MTTETHHDLHSEFPQHGDILTALKQDSAAFRALAERYHTVNREIHRIETGIEPASDDRLETLKKQRLAMLDEVNAAIVQKRNGA